MSGATNQIIAAMTGKNARLVVFQDNVKQLVDFESWNWKPNVTKHEDHINGAPTAELDHTFNFYELSGELFTRDINIVKVYIRALDVRLANTAPLVQQGGLRFEPNNGTKEAIVLNGLLWDDFDMKQGGRGSKIKTTVSMRFTRAIPR